MKTLIKKEVEITLVLNKKEAVWLRGMVQNPIGCDYEDEPERDSKMREVFWEALKEAK